MELGLFPLPVKNSYEERGQKVLQIPFFLFINHLPWQ